jgi:hypothetical protein
MNNSFDPNALEQLVDRVFAHAEAIKRHNGHFDSTDALYAEAKAIGRQLVRLEITLAPAQFQPMVDAINAGNYFETGANR